MECPKELAVERFIDAAPETVFKTWVDRFTDWWAPKPWTTEFIANDMRPGGAFEAVMRGPAGEDAPVKGVYLEIVPNRSIVFTNAFTAGWIPNEPFMTGVFTFEPQGTGTAYRAAARHWDEATCKRHEEMGFHTGWGQVTDQLAKLAEAEALSKSNP